MDVDKIDLVSRYLHVQGWQHTAPGGPLWSTCCSHQGHHASSQTTARRLPSGRLTLAGLCWAQQAAAAALARSKWHLIPGGRR